MSDLPDPTGDEGKVARECALDATLNQVTASVLSIVILAVVWIIVAAFKKSWAGFAAEGTIVLLIVAVLVTALLLVSAVALRQTRR